MSNDSPPKMTILHSVRPPYGVIGVTAYGWGVVVVALTVKDAAASLDYYMLRSLGAFDQS